MSPLFGVTTRSFHYVQTIGRANYAGSGFRNPVDLAIGREDVIYVLNRAREVRPDGVRITVCNLGEDYLRQFGAFGEGDGQFVWPISVDLDSQENLYVADQWLHRISIFDQDGLFLHKWGVPGSGDGQLSQPAGLSFDREDNLYVVDRQNNRVQKFSKDGKFLAKWGEAGSGPGQFNHPWGITIDHRGDVYVADWRNDRIQKFAPDGEYLAEFGASGRGDGLFNRPAGVAVDKDGDIYVADWGNDLVQVLTPDGRHITSFIGDATLSKWGQEKLAANPDKILERAQIRDFAPERVFLKPVAIEIDADGRILVVEAARHRVQIYQKDNY